MKAQLKHHNGTPTLFLDDHPAFFGDQLVGYMYPDNVNEHQPYSQKYGEAGVHIYSVDCLTHEWVGPRSDNPSHYDFSAIGPRLQSFVDVDPQAMFIVKLAVDTRSAPGTWFNAAYPDETELLSDGNRYSASFASTVWREQVNIMLTAVIAHLRAIGLYDRAVGFQIGAGSSGEWIKDMSCMMLPTMDYSAPMQRHFEGWLRAKYGTDAALQAAWANPAVTLATATVPSHEQQSETITGHCFRDSARERNVIDYYTCYAALCADDLIGFCHTIKELTGGDKLTGAYFGYVLELAWNMAFFADQGTLAGAEVSTMQASGHLGLHRVLHSPAVDFIVSPFSYAFRGLGGDGLPMSPAESLRHHGKLYVMEEDTIMHNMQEADGRNQAHEHSIAVYQRNFAQVITHALGVTWFETNQLHEVPELKAERQHWITRFAALGQWALDLDRTPASQVAVFLDDESYYYESIKNSLDIPLIWRQRSVSLSRFGAPHDIYYLDDLLDGDLPAYKLYIFLNPFHLNNQRRAALKDILRRDGRTALWLYAPGLLNDDTDQSAPNRYLDNMHDLTGLRFGQGNGPWGPLMHITNFTHPITHGLPQDLFWGSTNPVGPVFHVNDPQAINLGQIVTSLGRCKCGFALKTFNAGTPEAWSSVYMGSPDIPAAVLRGVARHAGVHLFSEAGDVLYATPDLLSVHTVSGGPRHFNLPHHVELIFDLFNWRILAHNADAFDVVLPPASTALYFAGKKSMIDIWL